MAKNTKSTAKPAAAKPKDAKPAKARTAAAKPPVKAAAKPAVKAAAKPAPAKAAPAKAAAKPAAKKAAKPAAAKAAAAKPAAAKAKSGAKPAGIQIPNVKQTVKQKSAPATNAAPVDSISMPATPAGPANSHISKTDVAVDIVNMHKWYGDFHVLKDINLHVMRGERIVICGPSGSGKSTMIRCINRLEEHQKGQIVVDGIELTNDLKKIDEVRREVGMVFQHFNLFPHLTILENCTLAPIWVRKMPKKQGRGNRDALSCKRVKIPEQAQQISRPALRRPAAARGDRPRRCA